MTTEQLIVLNKSLFKQQSDWRCITYAFIDYSTKWCDDLTRGRTWSILSTYTINEYLSCTAIREGYFNIETFLKWIQDELLSHYNPYPESKSIIYLNNINIHIDSRIQHAVEEVDLLLKFLSPYSSDFNLIELSFNVLKTWMRRYFKRL